MKITKQQLKQIIKEEIEKVLNESLIANIPAGAVVWQSADPMGINFKHTDPDGGEKKYGEIKLWDLEPQDLGGLAERNDLKFFFKHKKVDAREFVKALPEYWVKNNQSVAKRGKYVVSFLPEWVYKAAGIEPIPEEDPERR